jgi:transcriptional regulator with GAF, ATPase, and Fis domain
MGTDLLQTRIMPIQKPTDQERAAWETILDLHGHGMERGTLSRITYGWKYFDSERSLDYSKPDTNARQKFQNRLRGQWMKTLQQHGFSIRAIARIMQTGPANVHRTLRRYRANFEAA